MEEFFCRSNSPGYCALHCYGACMGISCPWQWGTYPGYGCHSFSFYVVALWTAWRIFAWRWKTSCSLAGVIPVNRDLCCVAADSRLSYEKMDCMYYGNSMVQ